jgi:hypothetical protein
MPQIKSLSTQVLDFPVKGEPKDGVPPTESLQPGESRNIDLRDPDTGVIVGMVVAGLIEIGGGKQARHKE